MNDTGRVLIAEDDPSMRSFLSDVLKGEGYYVDTADTGDAALEAIARSPYDVVLTDLKMPGADGMDVLSYVTNERPGTRVILLTAFGTIPNAVEAMRLGAFDYLTKPLDSPEVLRVTVARAIKAGRETDAKAVGNSDTEADNSEDNFTNHAVVRTYDKKRADSTPVRQESTGSDSNNAGIRTRTMVNAVDDVMRGLIFDAPASRRLLELVRIISERDVSVLLLGESGTGKEVVARLIHSLGPRKARPFVPVNCSAIPESLFESELFGHEKGAFTGAHATHKGFFEEADNGTILLDEVGELPLSLQAKLLRVLEERRITRVGAVVPRAIDVRVIAATNRDLMSWVQEGRFRLDLYYRLSVFPLQVPPLRERREDIIPMADAFLKEMMPPAIPEEEERVLHLSEKAAMALKSYSWPGNVRELRNVIERAAILAKGGVIEVSDLALGDASRVAEFGSGQGTSLKELERKAILDALEATGGNRRDAAKRLGIAVRTLQYKLKDLGLTKK